MDCPIDLPYYASKDSLPAPLPSVEEVLASKDFIGGVRRGAAVVRVGKHFMAKYGSRVRAVEGENAIFVHRMSRGAVKVPQVYAITKYGPDKATMLIMEYVRGETLERCMSRMSQRELSSMTSQLRSQVRAMRRIACPIKDYYGPIGRRARSDLRHEGRYVQNTSGHSQKFSSREMGRVLERFVKEEFEDRWRCGPRAGELRRRLMEYAARPGHGEPIFTHSDLLGRNIIVKPDGSPVIIDWELAGFFPAYFEYTICMSLDDQINFLDDKFPREAVVVREARNANAPPRRVMPVFRRERNIDTARARIDEERAKLHEDRKRFHEEMRRRFE